MWFSKVRPFSGHGLPWIWVQALRETRMNAWHCLNECSITIGILGDVEPAKNQNSLFPEIPPSYTVTWV
jgi:hypothetical protein